MIKRLAPSIRRIVGGAINMVKTIESYAILLGFILGAAYNLLEKIFRN